MTGMIITRGRNAANVTTNICGENSTSIITSTGANAIFIVINASTRIAFSRPKGWHAVR